MGYRNGHGKRRRLALLNGTITVRRPRVRGLEDRFVSCILPLFQRRTPEVAALLPELYLHGLASGDFELALRGLLGDRAPLSASAIQRLTHTWQTQYTTWQQRDLAVTELVYGWADGIYVNAGLESSKAALLVRIGRLADDSKVVLAVQSGQRESTESWAIVRRDLTARGLRAPACLVGDGALGLWSAVAPVCPTVAEQRCWNHKLRHVGDAVPLKQPRSVDSRSPGSVDGPQPDGRDHVARVRPVAQHGGRDRSVAAKGPSRQARILVKSEGRGQTVQFTVIPSAVARARGARHTVLSSPQWRDTVVVRAFNARDAAMRARFDSVTSSAPTIATVARAGGTLGDSVAIVKGVGVGSADLTFSYGTVRSQPVRVNVPLAAVQSVVVSPGSLTVLPGQRDTVRATLLDLRANLLTGRSCTATSSQPTVATFGGTGQTIVADCCMRG